MCIKLTIESSNNSSKEGPDKKEKELLTSKRTPKPGQQLLND